MATCYRCVEELAKHGLLDTDTESRRQTVTAYERTVDAVCADLADTAGGNCTKRSCPEEGVLDGIQSNIAEGSRKNYTRQYGPASVRPKGDSTVRSAIDSVWQRVTRVSRVAVAND